MDFLSITAYKDMENQLRNSYEQARKEAEFYKEKYFASEKKYHSQLNRPGRIFREEVK